MCQCGSKHQEILAHLHICPPCRFVRTTTGTSTESTTATSTLTTTTSITSTPTTTTTKTSSRTTSPTTTPLQCDEGLYRTADRRCLECDNLKCPEGEYRQGVCVEDQNGFTCHQCDNVQCPEGEFRKGKCAGETNDFSCHTCDNTECSSTSYRIGECSGEINEWTCISRPRCDPGEYLAGAGRFTAGKCQSCPNGSFVVSKQHFLDSCKNHTVCKVAEFEQQVPTLTSDRQCASIGTCSETEYTSAQPTRTSQRVCSQLTNCEIGQFVKVDSTDDSDRVCAACPRGQFSTQANSDECTTWKTCRKGERIAPGHQAGPTTDMACAACPSGTYQNVDKHHNKECKPQKKCQPGQCVAASTESQQICVLRKLRSATGAMCARFGSRLFVFDGYLRHALRGR